MKKFFSMVTAFCCTASMMAVLPAQAEEITETVDTYVVIAMNQQENPKTYIISDTEGNTYFLNAEKVASFADGNYFTVGDILEFHNIMSGVTCIWGTNDMLIQQNYEAKGDTFIEKTGSVFENAEIAEFELNHAVDEPETHYILSDGTETHYFFLDWGTDTYWQPDKYAYETLKDGNTYSFYTYQGQPMLFVSKSKTAPVLTVIATGDADKNGNLDILDVITVNKVAMGKETISDEIIPYIDFNQNGKPDADDALTMLKKIVGLA